METPTREAYDGPYRSKWPSHNSINLVERNMAINAWLFRL